MQGDVMAVTLSTGDSDLRRVEGSPPVIRNRYKGS